MIYTHVHKYTQLFSRTYDLCGDTHIHKYRQFSRMYDLCRDTHIHNYISIGDFLIYVGVHFGSRQL